MSQIMEAPVMQSRFLQAPPKVPLTQVRRVGPVAFLVCKDPHRAFVGTLLQPMFPLSAAVDPYIHAAYPLALGWDHLSVHTVNASPDRDEFPVPVNIAPLKPYQLACPESRVNGRKEDCVMLQRTFPDRVEENRNLLVADRVYFFVSCRSLIV